ncbi:hypothetical protein KIW84_054770 [Lathyrus oleraceus]|uniref:Uncharacterized protein n=1 Tax=Pisum sativum TaxID=3888 RepID=A0A9D4WTY5_PEA|nr:hypothetical protein KIW84_054770 [Pisum sativum]
MTFDAADFSERSTHRRSSIANANGGLSAVTGAGTVMLSPALSLSNTLLVPSLSHKLLSDILMKEINGRGTKRGGLYYMEDFSGETPEEESNWSTFDWFKDIDIPSTEVFGDSCQTQTDHMSPEVEVSESPPPSPVLNDPSPENIIEGISLRMEENVEGAFVANTKGKNQSYNSYGKKYFSEKKGKGNREEVNNRESWKKKFPLCQYCKKDTHLEKYCWYSSGVKCRVSNQLGHVEKKSQAEGSRKVLSMEDGLEDQNSEDEGENYDSDVDFPTRSTRTLDDIYASGNLQGYADSVWTGSVDDAKSTSSYVFSFRSDVFSWNSKKQEIVAQSLVEVEYIFVAATTNQIIWLRKILSDVGHFQNKTNVIWVDNKYAIAIAKNPFQHGRTKQIKVKYHVIRKDEKSKEISLEHCNSENQIPDIMTKALSKKKFNELRSILGEFEKNIKEEC